MGSRFSRGRDPQSPSRGESAPNRGTSVLTSSPGTSPSRPGSPKVPPKGTTPSPGPSRFSTPAREFSPRRRRYSWETEPEQVAPFMVDILIPSSPHSVTPQQQPSQLSASSSSSSLSQEFDGTSDDTSSTTGTEGPIHKTAPTWSIMGLLLRKDFLTILFVVVTYCVYFTKSHQHLMTRLAPDPTSFFATPAPVVDYTKGELSKLSIKVAEHEVSLVMYYAQWDLDSVRFKQHFENVARNYQHQLFVAAINCWWPEGECAKVMRLRRFPIVLAHVKDIGSIEYTGPLTPVYLMPFVENLLDPVVPVQSQGDLLELRSKHDAVVVRYCDFRNPTGPVSYNQLLNGAVKALEMDPWRKIQFSVVTSRKVAYKLRIARPNSLFVYLWNSTHEYSVDYDQAITDDYLKAIHDLVHVSGPLVDWITPNGLKSNILAAAVAGNPTLVLYTPRTTIFGISPYFEILRETASDYYNCDKSAMIKSLTHRSILRRIVMENRLMELEEKCHEVMSGAVSVSEVNNDSCHVIKTVRFRPANRTVSKLCQCKLVIQADLTKFPAPASQFNCSRISSMHRQSFDANEFTHPDTAYCSDIKGTIYPSYTPYYHVDVSCSGNFSGDYMNDLNLKLDPMDVDPETQEKHRSMFPFNNMFLTSKRDDRIEQMVQAFEKQYCSKLKIGLNYSDFTFPENPEDPTPSSSWRSNFTGLGCGFNQTLRFLAIDSILYPNFAESIGIPIQNVTHSTAVIIYDQQQESVFLLNSDTKSVYSSSSSSSPDLKRSSSRISPSSPGVPSTPPLPPLPSASLPPGGYPKSLITKRDLYQFVKNFHTKDLRQFLRTDSGIIAQNEHCLRDRRGNDVVCVSEVTTALFPSIVLNPRKDVLLFYYTPWCGFCSTMAHVYLQVARFFAPADKIVFTRINADKNDLPAEFKVDRYPSLILYPAQDKSDSIPFPTNMPITTTSLIQFVLANSAPIVRAQSSFQLCNRHCLLLNLKSLSSQNRILSRRITVTVSDINRAHMRTIYPRSFRHSKHEAEIRSFERHLMSSLRTMRSKLEGVKIMLNLLRKRTQLIVSGVETRVSQDFLNDMLNLIHSPQPRSTPSSKVVKKPKRDKKSKDTSKGRKNKEKSKEEL